MKKLTLIAAVAALMAIGRSAQAQLTEYYTAQVGGNPSPSSPVLQVVETTTGTYDYSYTFTLGNFVSSVFTPEVAGPNTDPVVIFSVGGLDPAGVNSISAGGTLLANSIIWSFGTTVPGDTEPGALSATVSYDSPNPPGVIVASAQDDTANWSGITLGPVAVPEASTVMAGALMLLPLGIGAIRAVRKERSV